ncbi:MAG: aminotransferase class V-fold PLP-dependent enzyme [Alphaproteobacteria bacterium]|nr:serine--glyoxylate aminotransferase [Rhodospirillaceae bacterium]MDP6304846.1 aminotransferase class V-fold PLP-dependent enzyme [Alphaproteobacteria bacterium]MDP7122650.1 aminotransferase class V-fold PLP-dependent enzyme [Alphaproteobacteria bacterium]MEE1561881.1 aminotransferase class V-fold PLP-dependent enzyme [Alphaproteobacteria bacterium]MEE1568627.1 aminotransferase class V-fold PLP-dependent enzyme [Alphaproteobacteria bacterium]
MSRKYTGHFHAYIPGPTNIPPRILNAAHIPTEDMRSPAFPELTKPLFEDLKKIFKTKDGQVFIFPSSGTGAWESAITNTMSPGEKVLIYRFGQFSLLWVDMFERLGLDVDVRDVEWGTGTPPEDVEATLKADTNHEYKVVCVTHNETATGVTSDVLPVRQAIDAANHPAMLFVDGVSSIASIDFRMDEWGVDCAISGSQKGFMLPAGVGLVCASQKALEANKSAKMTRCYLSWEDMIKTNKDGYFPYTPPTPMLHALRASIDMLMEEGLDNVFARHHRLAEGVRHAVKDGWGLKLCAKEEKWESDTVSAIVVPKDKDAKEVIATAYNKYHLSLGAGLTQVAGKVFRIGHLGDLNELMLASSIVGAEMAMLDNGFDIKAGSGIAAASDYWRNN